MTDQPNSASACASCPGHALTFNEWMKLCKPPFRKRHPVIFWLGMILLFICIGMIPMCMYVSKDNDGLERIALIEVTGPIMDVAPTLEWIRTVGNNSKVKGVLLRVDSPGGGAAASQEIYAAIARIASKLPVVVSMGSAAASGGLMVSMAGNQIFANPSTVTGSIGVRMDIPQLQGLMGKLGIGQETLTTGPYKDAASITKPMTPEDRAYLENLIMNMHKQFVGIVAKSRKMPLEQAYQLANGKIYTGEEALALGLVDALGGFEDALDWIAGQSGVPAQRELLKKPVSRTKILERLLAMGEAMEEIFSKFVTTGQVAPYPQPAFWY